MAKLQQSEEIPTIKLQAGGSASNLSTHTGPVLFVGTREELVKQLSPSTFRGRALLVVPDETHPATEQENLVASASFVLNFKTAALAKTDIPAMTNKPGFGWVFEAYPLVWGGSDGPLVSGNSEWQFTFVTYIKPGAL